MKKLNNKKGFTIVELVIVIAVIGILAGVLIPTFSNVTKSANETAAMEEAKNSLTAVLSANQGAIATDSKFVVKGEYVFNYENGALQTTADDEATITDKTLVMYVNDKLVTIPEGKTYVTALGTDAGASIAAALTKVGITAEFGEGKNATFAEGTSASSPAKITVTVGSDTYTITLLVASDVTKNTVVIIPDSK